jgi:hypothetical protein
MAFCIDSKKYYMHIKYMEVWRQDDVPPNSSRNPKVGLRMKQRKKEKVGAHFLTRSSNTPLYPSKCCELRSVPQLLLLPLFPTWAHIWVLWGVGSASVNTLHTWLCSFLVSHNYVPYPCGLQYKKCIMCFKHRNTFID